MANTYTLHTNNLSCASCAAKIEDDLKTLDSVLDASVNIINHTATIISDCNITEQVNAVVKKHEPDVTFTETKQNEKITFPKHLVWISALFISSMVISRTYINENISLLYTSFYLGVYLLTGKNVIRAFFLNLKKRDFFDENFLMFIATAGAIAIGAYEEAAGVMLFYSLGEAFEDLAVRRSNKEITNLASLKPEKAFKIINDSPVEILPENIIKNDLLLIKSGEIIPIDGVITEGSSNFDMSSITGEANPVFLEKGDQVISGSILLSDAVKIEAEVDYMASTTSRIAKLISDAVSNKSDTEKFITKFSRVYTPVVVALAVLVILIPIILKLSGFEFFDNSYSNYFYNGLIFLVISCPCALVLSVPLTYFAGIGKAANKGILIKGSSYLEQIRKSDTFIFDKTGTITEGKFSINNIYLHPELEKDIDEKYLLKMIAELENYSTHPIANAFKNIVTTGIKADDIKEMAGKGITGTVNGRFIALGNKRLVNDYNLDLSDFNITKEGVNLFVIIDNKAAATISIQDNLKKDASETFHYLHNKGLKTVILSGDSSDNVASAADQLEISEYYSTLLPEQKIEKMKSFKSLKNTVTALGDGINDAPLLAASDIGIAMGSTGAALSVEMADIIFLGSKLGRLPTLLKIANKTHRVVLENIIFIMTVKIAIMTAGAFGYATLWEAVIADVGVALVTVLNSIKIFKGK
ncbi:MAG: cadmium-translocating P-type ATPase [Spirochaetales bacterium]|nr:cadmium-translocating P-type ATPase [Spirochaetales bacterium]